jgi:hypothetical protein
MPTAQAGARAGLALLNRGRWHVRSETEAPTQDAQLALETRFAWRDSG